MCVMFVLYASGAACSRPGITICLSCAGHVGMLAAHSIQLAKFDATFPSEHIAVECGAV